MWIDLGMHILQEFAERSARCHGERDFAYRLRIVEPRDPRDQFEKRREMIGKHRRLLARRVATAAVRPPCPQCGGAVTRLGTTGTLPKYCTAECMRTAKRLRFEAKRR